MATVKKAITSTGWTLVSATASGFMENQGPSVVKYRTSATLPASSDDMGHQLDRSKSIGWSRQTAENIYARTISGTADLIVTEG